MIWTIFHLPPRRLEVQWAYNVHLLHLQWGTIHGLHAYTVGAASTLLQGKMYICTQLTPLYIFISASFKLSLYSWIDADVQWWWYTVEWAVSSESEYTYGGCTVYTLFLHCSLQCALQLHCNKVSVPKWPSPYSVATLYDWRGHSRVPEPLHSHMNDSYYKSVVLATLSEAISSLGCRRNSSDGSMLIRQLTEVQFLTSFKTATLGVFSVRWTGCHLSQLY